MKWSLRYVTTNLVEKDEIIEDVHVIAKLFNELGIYPQNEGIKENLYKVTSCVNWHNNQLCQLTQ